MCEIRTATLFIISLTSVVYKKKGRKFVAH